MEITARGLWTIVHGMGFGAFYLLACSGAILELWRRYSPSAQASIGTGDERLLRIYFLVMTILAWLTVLSGTYVIYPWYRAAAPPGTADLSAFPQRLLMSNPSTAEWHSLGMEWKEHVAWLVPIAISMATAVFFRYGRSLRSHAQLRNIVLAFVWVSFFAAGVAGFFGAMLNKNAPVTGGEAIHLMRGE